MYSYKMLLSASIVFWLIACESKKTASEKNSDTITVATNGEQSYAQMNFESTTYDFGQIKQGDVVKYTFIFTNNSETPLQINSAQASCGCTVPDYPKEPVMPGKQGKIEVQFNSAGKLGTQNKTVQIVANTLPNTTTLVLKGEILPKEEPKTP